MALLAANMIDRPPVDKREQPGDRFSTLLAVPTGLPPCIQKPFLHRILGEVSIAEHPDCERQSHVGVPRVELSEGALVALSHAREQVLVASD